MKAADVYIREIDAISAITDSSVVERLDAALDGLVAACSTQAETAIALEMVYGCFARRRRSRADTPVGRYIARRIDERQGLALHDC